MTPELREAAKNTEIKNELINKISRERVGIEYEKMITGPYPLLSLQLIHDLDLYFVIMAPPASIKSGTIGESSLAVSAIGALEWLCFKDSLQLENLKVASNTEKRNLILSASALPYLDVTSEVKKKEIPAVQLVFRDSIKVSVHIYIYIKFSRNKVKCDMDRLPMAISIPFPPFSKVFIYCRIWLRKIQKNLFHDQNWVC